MGRKCAKTVAVYTRTSSKANLGSSSASRQRKAASVTLTSLGDQLHNRVQCVSETISGMVPLDQRVRLKELLNGEKVAKVFVESARAIARSAIVAEEAWQMSKANGVEIIAADLPQLFKHDPNPGETLLRRVMLAVQEFERDMIVMRLAHGLSRKRATSSRRTQAGTVKVNGSLSILEKTKPTKRQVAALRMHAKKHMEQEFGWRPLAQRFSKVLKLPADMAVETARRLKVELQKME